MSIFLTESQSMKIELIKEHLEKDVMDDEKFSQVLIELSDQGVGVAAVLKEQGIDLED